MEEASVEYILTIEEMNFLFPHKADVRMTSLQLAKKKHLKTVVFNCEVMLGKTDCKCAFQTSELVSARTKRYEEDAGSTFRHQC